MAAERVTLADLEKLFHETYEIVDPYVIKFLQAVVVTQSLESDPFWPFIIGSSSSGKTEFLTSLYHIPDTYPVTNLTSKTLLSGAKGGGKETSLLLRIQNGLIVIEDFTALQSMHREESKEIMSQFRIVHGGKYDRKVGTGEDLTWEGKITIIAGTTHSIHQFRQQFAFLGERFVNYILIQPDRIKAARKAMHNASKLNMRERRDFMRERVAAYHAGLKFPKENTLELDEALINELLKLADFVTIARSSVPRDWYSPGKDINDLIDFEMPSRFASLLTILAKGLMIVNLNEYGKTDLTDLDKKLLYKVTLDSITNTRRRVLQELARYQSATTKSLAIKMDYSTPTLRRWLQDVNALQLCYRHNLGGNEGDTWQLKDEYRELMHKFDAVELVDYDLTKDSLQSKEGIEREEVDDTNFESDNLEDNDQQEVTNIDDVSQIFK